MKHFLPIAAGLLVTALILMGALVVQAAMERSVMDNGHLMSDVWFQVTLLDAYIGLSIFYAWVAYKERSFVGRILWFVLIMTLGNLATSSYLLIQFYRRPDGQILLRDSQNTA